jgi:hypothetical protein
MRVPAACNNQLHKRATARHRVLSIVRWFPLSNGTRHRTVEQIHKPQQTAFDKESPFMQRIVRALACCALVSSLAACVVEPQQAAAPRPGPNPHEVAVQRFEQVEGRINNEGRHIDARVNQGYYPPPVGGDLHHRLDVIRLQARDMAAQRGGGLSGDEARALNEQLNGEAQAIGE